VKINEWDIIIYNHSGNSHRVKYYYGCYDPLQYPLLFSCGDIGWHEGIEVKTKAEKFYKDDLINDLSVVASAEDIIQKEEKG